MKTTYKNGAIIVDGNLYEQVIYDVAGPKVSAEFYGDGTLSGYWMLEDSTNYTPGSQFSIYVDKFQLDPYTKKTVTMIGRMQKIEIHDERGEITLLQFISRDSSTVFFELTFDKPELNYDFVYGYGSWGFIPNIKSNCSFNEIPTNFDYYFDLNHTKTLRYVVSFDKEVDLEEELSKFDYYKEVTLKEIEEVDYPKTCTTELDKAIYQSCYFCGLENYREKRDFKAFSAGLKYINPLRTYFRDGYFTTLAMYKQHSDLVKLQILALSRAIFEDGTCPSAYRSDNIPFWANHFDSPSFYVMMVYDYINYTSDLTILDEVINGVSIYDKCIHVIDKMITFCDENNLIYKEGPLNKRDWADEVNRNGYCTYVEFLFLRSLWCLIGLLNLRNDDASKYEKQFKLTKDAVDNILWNEELGYYNNYVDKDFVCDNLSVDTCVGLIFNLVSKDRAERILNNMENLLESKNNKLQKAGDYGVMCLYPFYERIGSAANRSQQSYNYHNGGNWPYLSCLYAYSKYINGRDGSYALKSWFTYNIEKGNYTPIEYFSPCRKTGSLLQGWSAMGAFCYDFMEDDFFKDRFIKRGK